MGWSGNVRNHPKENKKAFTEQGIMFFRNTHVAHKILRKPYFTGCVVLQTLILVTKEIIISQEKYNSKRTQTSELRFWGFS